MENFDVIIIGGSYAGLSAAMSLGRSLRKVLVLDNGKPCNRQTPHSHNFITHDGKKPDEISDAAKKQVSAYETISFHNGTVVKMYKKSDDFVIITEKAEEFQTKKLILASGIKDKMLNIPGFSDCWGISVIHCPYCHGFEVRGKMTGIISNGDTAFEFSKIVYNLTKNLKVLTNGKSTFSKEQVKKLTENGIDIIEEKISEIVHKGGQIQRVIFENHVEIPFEALYAKVPFEQNINTEDLDLELTEHGFIRTDHFQKTNIDGVFACGDNATMMRSVANAVAQGNFTGAMVNRELSGEEF